MINLFGITIEAPSLTTGLYYEDLLSSVAKRSSEREILRNFLTSRLPEIVSETQNELDNIDIRQYRPQAINFYLSYLKSTGAYENMVLRTIASDHQFSSVHTASEMLKGKQPALPSTFPGDHKKAESLVVGTVSSSVGNQECHQYLHRQLIKSRIQDIAKDLFYAINNGLNEEQSVRFMSIMYELNGLKTADFIQPTSLKKAIVSGIKGQCEIEFVHVKCLRFTYPKSGGVKILTDTNDTIIDGVSGKYSPKSEELLFDRLQNIENIFRSFQVPVKTHVILADEDIDLLFPDDHQFINCESKQQAKLDCQKYYDYLVKEYGSRFSFSTINRLVSEISEPYYRFRKNIIDSLYVGNGQYMPPNFFEHDRVDHQYEYYQRLFGRNYSRQEARRSISEQVASVIALQLVLEKLSPNSILVEENREGENRLIAGGKFPIIFTKLRDEAKFNLV